MEQRKAEQLKAKWQNDDCEHSLIEQVYLVGIPTHRYACTSCGREFPEKDYGVLMRERENQSRFARPPRKPTSYTGWNIIKDQWEGL